MRWLDLDGVAPGGEIDEDKVRQQIERELEMTQKREKAEDMAYQEKKSELMQEASEREKKIYE